MLKKRTSKNILIGNNIWRKNMKIFKKILFWSWLVVWATIPMLMGAFVALALIIAGKKPRIHYNMLTFEIGYNWGGFSCGFVKLVSVNPSEHLSVHEWGHAAQMVILGNFSLLLVMLPSVIRYWHRKWIQKHWREKHKILPPYDSIWFEGTASQLGYKYLLGRKYIWKRKNGSIV